jgi:hypothetical protein
MQAIRTARIRRSRSDLATERPPGAASCVQPSTPPPLSSLRARSSRLTTPARIRARPDPSAHSGRRAARLGGNARAGVGPARGDDAWIAWPVPGRDPLFPVREQPSVARRCAAQHRSRDITVSTCAPLRGRCRSVSRGASRCRVAQARPSIWGCTGLLWWWAQPRCEPG